DIQRPIGWSAAMVSADGADAGRGLHGNAYVDNPATAARAESSMHTPLGPAFSGLPDSRDLADTDPASRATTGITVRAAKAHADTLTAGNAAQARPGGRLALFDARPASGELVALSRAEVYFDRIAARADGQVERQPVQPVLAGAARRAHGRRQGVCRRPPRRTGAAMTRHLT